MEFSVVFLSPYKSAGGYMRFIWRQTNKKRQKIPSESSKLQHPRESFKYCLADFVRKWWEQGDHQIRQELIAKNIFHSPKPGNYGPIRTIFVFLSNPSLVLFGPFPHRGRRQSPKNHHGIITLPSRKFLRVRIFFVRNP